MTSALEKVAAAVDALLNRRLFYKEDRSVIRMKNQKGLFDTRRRALCVVFVVSCVVLFARHLYVYGQTNRIFPTASMLSKPRPRVTE